MTTSKALHGIDPLKDLLSEVLSRLESLETKVGIAPTSHHHAHSNSSVSFSAPTPNEANLAGEWLSFLYILHCTAVLDLFVFVLAMCLTHPFRITITAIRSSLLFLFLLSSRRRSPRGQSIRQLYEKLRFLLGASL